MDARSTFSLAPEAYARSRPTYPPELFAWIAAACRNRDAAWDCATGNGQAAVGLSNYFDAVEATDISPEQIERGLVGDRIRYSAQPAERTDFDDARFDLVAVAQALHWFDYGGFWPEVRRVAKPGAFFCAWGYSWFEGQSELHRGFADPLLEILDSYWAPNNRLLWAGYQSGDVRFPFARVEAPAFAIEVRWTIAEILDYVRTWSAHKRASADQRIAGELARWETDAAERFAARGPMTLTMPIAIVAGPIS